MRFVRVPARNCSAARDTSSVSRGFAEFHARRPVLIIGSTVSTRPCSPCRSRVLTTQRLGEFLRCARRPCPSSSSPRGARSRSASTPRRRWRAAVRAATTRSSILALVGRYRSRRAFHRRRRPATPRPPRSSSSNCRKGCRPCWPPKVAAGRPRRLRSAAHHRRRRGGRALCRRSGPFADARRERRCRSIPARARASSFSATPWAAARSRSSSASRTSPSRSRCACIRPA